MIRLRIVVAISKKTIFRPISKHFRHAFSNPNFRNLNSPYTDTLSKKKIQTAKNRCFERTLYCKIIIVARSRNDAGIVRTKPEKHTTCHSYSKHSLLRARRSYHLARLPSSFRKPYASFLFCAFFAFFLRIFVPSVLFLRFSVLFCAFCAFCVFRAFCGFLCVFTVSASAFSSFIPTIGLKCGAPKRRSVGVSMVFSLFRSGAFPLLPAAVPHLQKSVFAMFAQLRRKQFSPPAEYKTGIAKQNRFAILL